MDKPTVLANVMITPDGTVLQSFTGHDYKTHDDKNGEHYMIDGGNSYYGRSSVNVVEPTRIFVTTDSPFELIHEWMHWGTRGKSGRDPLKYVPLKDLEVDHIQAILETQTHIGSGVRKAFLAELAFREANTLESELPKKVESSNFKPKVWVSEQKSYFLH